LENQNIQIGGSWSQEMRPDYSVSIWPSEFSENEAENQELIVHIHFDAKYKVESLKYLFESEESSSSTEDPNSLSEYDQVNWQEFTDKERAEQKEGIYKRVDLLKMHAYKDAIRRTAGAYILYPRIKNH
jgi:Protein of unknown function (DUF524).